jgi:mRNA-degrading endonuclease RelE of RelBE toxin-antitoxin system
LTGGTSAWRIRIGEIIYDIDGAQQKASVLIVGHRRDVYDR